MKRFSKEDKCNAWKLWYDKKSQILCDICYESIPEIVSQMDSFEYEPCRKTIDNCPKRETRTLRYHIWYLLDIGFLNIERFKKNESRI